MKNLFRFAMAAVLCAFLFNFANAQDAQYIKLLYGKMDKNLKTLTSLKTGIRKETYNSQLKEVEDRREGTALIIPVKNTRTANFRLDWTKGVQESLSVVDGKYKLYQPKAGQVIEGKNKEVQKGSGGAESAFKLINMSAKDLKTNFDAQWNGTEIVANVHSAYKLTLTPKTPQTYNKAEIWINEEGMVVQFKVYEKNGDWTNILLFDIVRNAKISKSEIALKVPAGTKVVKG